MGGFNLGATSLGQDSVVTAKVRNHTGSTVERGRPVQLALAADSFTTKNPATGLAHGVLRHDVPAGDQHSTGLVVQGATRCYFKNHASAEVGTYCAMVVDNGDVFLTYSADTTNIILLTDQTDGTAIHGPEGPDAPVVLVLAGGPVAEFIARVAGGLQDQIDAL